MRGHLPVSRLRSGMPWIAFGLALIVATEPAWKIPLMGFSPTLDDLLSITCFGKSH